jgi:hypothetical protein
MQQKSTGAKSWSSCYNAGAAPRSENQSALRGEKLKSKEQSSVIIWRRPVVKNRCSPLPSAHCFLEALQQQQQQPWGVFFMLCQCYFSICLHSVLYTIHTPYFFWSLPPALVNQGQRNCCTRYLVSFDSGFFYIISKIYSTIHRYVQQKKHPSRLGRLLFAGL